MHGMHKPGHKYVYRSGGLDGYVFSAEQFWSDGERGQLELLKHHRREHRYAHRCGLQLDLRNRDDYGGGKWRYGLDNPDGSIAVSTR